MKLPKIPELKVKYKRGKVSNKVKLKNSDEVANLLRSIYDADQLEWREELIMLLLDNKLEVIGYYKISSGGRANTIYDPRMIFSVALTSGAMKFIISHNHPSGNLVPSKADIEMTKELAEGGKILHIELLDHVIITTDDYYSFANDNLL